MCNKSQRESATDLIRWKCKFSINWIKTQKENLDTKANKKITTNIIQNHTERNCSILSRCFKFGGLVAIFKIERIFRNQREKYSNPRRKIDICRKSTEGHLKVIFNSMKDAMKTTGHFTFPLVDKDLFLIMVVRS